jgi:hypothetical protein
MSLQHNRPGDISETNYESEYLGSFLNVENYALRAYTTYGNSFINVPCIAFPPSWPQGVDQKVA